MLLKPTKDRNDDVTWRCRKVHHVCKNEKKYTVKDVKISIQSDTWLSDSNLSLNVIVELIYLWTQRFTNSELQHKLKIGKQTLIEWTAFFREVCLHDIFDNSQQIGGEGIEVEIDESKFGKRKYYRGHKVDGQWVFSGREKYDKSKIFMVPVAKRDAQTLLPIISEWIAKGSIIHSDCWKVYSQLKNMGYHHVTVNHSKKFVNPKNAACTNSIEMDWRHAKVSMPTYGVHKGLHAGYLAEFLWMRKHHDKDKFMELIKTTNKLYKEGKLFSIKC